MRDNIVLAGTIVGKEVLRLKIKRSKNSVVVPISAATQSAAFCLIKFKTPVLLRVANSVDDVGVEMGGGKR